MERIVGIGKANLDGREERFCAVDLSKRPARVVLVRNQRCVAVDVVENVEVMRCGTAIPG